MQSSSISVLPDPYNDRPINHLALPPNRSLSSSLLFPDKSSANLDIPLLQDFLYQEGTLSKDDFVRLISEATLLFRAQSSLVQLQDPVQIVGDLHGQFYDFCNLLKNLGPLDSTNSFIFMGDYVDRGMFAVEILAVLFAMKIKHKDNLVLLRGNHESRTMTSHFNFREEVLFKYDQEVYDMLMFAFDCLPLACVVNKQFICMHGGINQEMSLGVYSALNALDRFQEVPDQGSMCDLTWSDPMTESDYRMAKSNVMFIDNKSRMCSNKFSYKAVKQFLKRNKLKTIIRGHEVFREGYKFHNINHQTSMLPELITIFSAPNYCDSYNNLGAFLEIKGNNLNVKQFKHVHHPYVTCDHKDVFSITFPHLMDSVNMVMHKLFMGFQSERPDSDDEDELMEIQAKEDIEPSHTNEGADNLKQKIKNKVIFQAKMNKMFNILQNNSETIGHLKEHYPDHKLPCNMLRNGSQALVDQLAKFEQTKELDAQNEIRPKKYQKVTLNPVNRKQFGQLIYNRNNSSKKKY